MTTNERAQEVERLAHEIAASMAVFPKLNAKDQTTLAIGGDMLIERLHVAWPTFAARDNGRSALMNRDPFDVYKAEIEEHDRVKSLAADARVILSKLEDREDRTHEELIIYLMSNGSFSWREAHGALEYIDWDDNRYDGESDP